MEAVAVPMLIVASLLMATVAGAQPQLTLIPQSPGLGTGTDPIAVASGDLDGDGNIDLVAANSGSDDVSIFWGNGDGTFTAATATIPVGTAPGGEGPIAVTIVDANGDGKLDILTANELGNSISAIINQGGRAFGTPIESPAGTSPEAIAVGDFNGDGALDVATPNLLDDTVTILLGDKTGNFSILSVCANQATQICHSSSDCPSSGACNPQPVPVDTDPDAIVAVDLNKDGILDLVVANSGGGTDQTGTLTVLQGQGSGGVGNGFFVAQPEISSPIFDNPVFLATADLNTDGKPDVVVVNDYNDSLSVLIGNGDLTFQSAVALNLSAFAMPEAVTIADFNHDGILDIASSASLQDKVSVFLGQADGSFAAAVDFPLPLNSTPFGIVSADFDKDNSPDVAVADMTDPGMVTVLLNATGVTLAAGITATDTTLTLTNAVPFPSSGTILIDQEQISYTGRSGNTLTGLTRGSNGTAASGHAAGAAVVPAPAPTPTPTPTPMVTPTPGGSCVGDCNGDHTVTVDEIVSMVNLALNGGTTGCPAGDANGDGTITVDEIITAVNNALNGCNV